jgi:hypothetical protein
VSDALADDLDRNARLQQQGGMRVAKVVEADAGQSGSLDEPPERIGQELRMRRPAVGPAEHPRL